MRILKSVGLIVVSFFLASMSSGVIGILSSASESSSENSTGVAYVVFFAFWGFLATRVGYRWWDFLFTLIPVYGLFWIWKIAFRTAYLPNCDWQPKTTDY